MRLLRTFYIISSDEDKRAIRDALTDWWLGQGGASFYRRPNIIPMNELDYTGLVPKFIVIDPTARDHQVASDKEDEPHTITKLCNRYPEAHIILVTPPGELSRHEVFDLLELGANSHMEKRYEDITKVLNSHTLRIRSEEVSRAAAAKAMRARKEKKLASAA